MDDETYNGFDPWAVYEKIRNYGALDKNIKPIRAPAPFFMIDFIPELILCNARIIKSS